ncbi:ureidoglycolate hydrolase [Zalerion maritima]|uniref:Ureidoglycolate hydrolase n=1 Tax=Zalerion maritima TaxID=339359 RepID=A0AAD5RF55_9PEZI|nr:ureidoglycolate hydrolase [Zalerion maritima]
MTIPSYSAPIQFAAFSSTCCSDEKVKDGDNTGGGSGTTRGTSTNVSVEVKVVTAQPLTRDNFSPFGDAIYNPRPGRRWDPPAAATKVIADQANLPFPVNAANQGTALRYAPVSNLQDLTAQAPSRNVPSALGEGRTVVGGPTMSMFVCSSRQLEKPGDDNAAGSKSEQIEGVFPVKILERHPYTSQTFIPLSSTPGTKYLIVVAPTLPQSDPANPPVTVGLPVPKGETLPGAGMPDLSRLQAFVSEGFQAVTYAAGTWHAPMVVLRNPSDGEGDEPLSFVVYQSNTTSAAENCQEVVFTVGNGKEEVAGAKVKVPLLKEKSKL